MSDLRATSIGEAVSDVGEGQPQSATTDNSPKTTSVSQQQTQTNEPGDGSWTGPVPLIPLHAIQLIKRDLKKRTDGNLCPPDREGVLVEDVDPRLFTYSMRPDSEMGRVRAYYGIPKESDISEIVVSEYPMLEDAIHSRLMFKYRGIVSAEEANQIDVSTDEGFYGIGFLPQFLDQQDGRFENHGFNLIPDHFVQFYSILDQARAINCGMLMGRLKYWESFHSGWAEVFRQLYLPNFILFADMNEAQEWCPPLSKLAPWRRGEHFRNSPSWIGGDLAQPNEALRSSVKMWLWVENAGLGWRRRLVRGYLV